MYIPWLTRKVNEQTYYAFPTREVYKDGYFVPQEYGQRQKVYEYELEICYSRILVVGFLTGLAYWMII